VLATVSATGWRPVQVLESLAEARIQYYQRAARRMVDQPGLKPVYPGLHELHQTLIAAAVRSVGLDPRATRQELRQCRSLEEILEAQGHSGQQAVEATMQFLDRGLDRMVANQRLSEEQHNDWRASLRESLETMVSVPGLHVAGKPCAQ